MEVVVLVCCSCRCCGSAVRSRCIDMLLHCMRCVCDARGGFGGSHFPRGLADLIIQSVIGATRSVIGVLLADFVSLDGCSCVAGGALPPAVRRRRFTIRHWRSRWLLS